MPRRLCGIASRGAIFYSLFTASQRSPTDRRDLMNTPFNTRQTTANIGAFFAAAVVTTVIVGSQFGLAQRYDAQAHAVMAGQALSGQVAQSAVQDPAA